MASHMRSLLPALATMLSLALLAAIPLQAMAAPHAEEPRARGIATENITSLSPSLTPNVEPSTSVIIEKSSTLEQVRALYEEKQAALAASAAAQRTDKVLSYDPALIAQIGNQSSGGHTVCCPGYACAYGDAVLTGQARDHSYYGCGSCTWPGWGGGNSSFRSLGSDAVVLREAYDEIAAGRPTVMHVSGPYGEHWICLIGYQGVADPDALTLDNFIALDPSNGQEVVASYRYVPYGDACQHVSELR
ncbi:hypothetical protein [Gordonibacter sp.]|uniref:hypothetical protein n=1 Tax=Gordonibacter sp. TaxID=1968902 RepID=UPI002FC61F22